LCDARLLRLLPLLLFANLVALLIWIASLSGHKVYGAAISFMLKGGKLFASTVKVDVVVPVGWLPKANHETFVWNVAKARVCSRRSVLNVDAASAAVSCVISGRLKVVPFHERPFARSKSKLQLRSTALSAGRF